MRRTAYTATAYNLGAEASYTFGPFTSSEAVAFADRHVEGWGEWHFAIINDPSTCGTGLEETLP